MKIDMIEMPRFSQAVVGNVYPVKGGTGARCGHCMVMINVTKAGAALFVVIDRCGEIVGVTSYGIHAIEDRCPIAFVPGMEEMVFRMEKIQ